MTTAPRDSIAPVVLVGGRSRRFGRDKLLEPWGSGVLVHHPIRALREVFGNRVLLVGDANPALAPLADGILPDLHPGAGPLGGIITALRSTRLDVFVLAGDLPNVDPPLVRRVLAAASENPARSAILAAGDHPEPCIGLYRRAALDVLEPRLRRAELALHAALTELDALAIPCEPRLLANINHPSDAARHPEHPRLDSNQRPTD